MGAMLAYARRKFSPEIVARHFDEAKSRILKTLGNDKELSALADLLINDNDEQYSKSELAWALGITAMELRERRDRLNAHFRSLFCWPVA